MAYLLLEESFEEAELALSLNGLPLARSSTLRPGDRIRAGRAVVRYCDEGGPASMVAEPRLDYRPEHHPASRAPPLDRTDSRAALARSPELVAEAPCMRRLLARVRKVAAHESNVLILGESGTGKELVAQAIRANGPRAERPFVSVNAAALPEQILESELFGHERGAFTGALARRQGLFELASGGTLFLDEVGDLASSTQAKLLRVLESGELRRLGGSETILVDVRLLAATNRDLRREVARSAFREDLFYRIAVVELRIPPLRERPEDVEPLANHLLARLGRSALRPRVTLSPEALLALRRYPFPGNVRELRNCLESALNFCDGDTIALGDLPPQVTRTVPVDEGFPTLAAVERAHVETALRRAQWNKSRAAALLGIDRKTLYLKIETYGLGPGTSAFEDEPSPAGGSQMRTE